MLKSSEPDRILKQGIKEQTNHDSGDFSLAIEEFKRNGFAVIPSSFSLEEIKSLRKNIEIVRKYQLDEFGAENLALINDENIVRSLIEYDNSFLEVAFEDNLIQFSKKVLSDFFVMIYQNGVFNRPSKERFESAKWHRDLNYQHWVATKPIALNALLCIDPFNEYTGGTEILSGSHLFEEFPSDLYVQKYKQQVDVKSGYWIVMNSMLYHQTGINNSDGYRFGINQMFGLPFLSQHVELFDKVKSQYQLQKYNNLYSSGFVKGFLGERWKPASSSYEWRMSKIENLKEGLNA